MRVADVRAVDQPLQRDPVRAAAPGPWPAAGVERLRSASRAPRREAAASAALEVSAGQKLSTISANSGTPLDAIASLTPCARAIGGVVVRVVELVLI